MSHAECGGVKLEFLKTCYYCFALFFIVIAALAFAHQLHDRIKKETPCDTCNSFIDKATAFKIILEYEKQKTENSYKSVKEEK